MNSLGCDRRPNGLLRGIVAPPPAAVNESDIGLFAHFREPGSGPPECRWRRRRQPPMMKGFRWQRAALQGPPGPPARRG